MCTYLCPNRPGPSWRISSNITVFWIISICARNQNFRCCFKKIYKIPRWFFLFLVSSGVCNKIMGYLFSFIRPKLMNLEGSGQTDTDWGRAVHIHIQLAHIFCLPPLQLVRESKQALGQRLCAFTWGGNVVFFLLSVPSEWIWSAWEGLGKEKLPFEIVSRACTI